MDEMLKKIKDLAQEFDKMSCCGVGCCNCPFDKDISGIDSNLCQTMENINNHFKGD